MVGKNRMNQADFIEKSLEVHGDKYDYSAAEYLNSQSRVSIICKEHGIFEMAPSAHLSGRGCHECANARTKKYRDKRMSQEDFIKKSFLVHGDKYDYSAAEYLNSQSRVSIICKQHGNFSISPKVFLRGTGCPFCKRMEEEFVEESKAIHGEKNDYSGVMYSLVPDIETKNEETIINPFEIEIKNEGPNFTLYRNDKPIKISKKLFDLKREVIITHTSRDLLDHIISELDGQGETKFDEEKGEIVGPEINFSALALFTLQKDLIESEKEELSDQLEGLVFSDPLLLPYKSPNLSEQIARYSPLEKWLGQSWNELYSLAKGLMEEPFWEEDNKIFKQCTSAECVLRVRDEYKSLSLEERTVVSYLRNMHDSPILFPIALVKGHCSVAEYARGIMASRNLFNSLNESITTDQQRSFFVNLSSEASKTIDYINYFRKGTPNKYINDLIENGESEKLEFKSTLRWDLVKDKKENYITDSCMKSIAAFMNTNGGKLVIGVSDNGEYVGIDKDRLETDDRFKIYLHEAIEYALDDEASAIVKVNIYQVDQYKVCVVECPKGREFKYCKEKEIRGKEHSYIRTGPKTKELQPSELDSYKKSHFGSN